MTRADELREQARRLVEVVMMSDENFSAEFLQGVRAEYYRSRQTADSSKDARSARTVATVAGEKFFSQSKYCWTIHASCGAFWKLCDVAEKMCTALRTESLRTRRRAKEKSRHLSDDPQQSIERRHAANPKFLSKKHVDGLSLLRCGFIILLSR